MKTATFYALPSLHYLIGNFIGSVLGTVLNYPASRWWAFAKRR